MFLCDEFALAREIISTIFDCAEYVHMVHLDVLTSYSPMNISLMVGPEFAPLKASTVQCEFSSALLKYLQHSVTGPKGLLNRKLRIH